MAGKSNFQLLQAMLETQFFENYSLYSAEDNSNGFFFGTPEQVQEYSVDLSFQSMNLKYLTFVVVSCLSDKILVQFDFLNFLC